MGTLVKPFNYVNQQVIDASQLDSNLDTLYIWANGNVDEANIKSGINQDMNGIVDAKSPAYKATGSQTATTGSITSGNNILNLGSPIDFANGQGINVAGNKEASSLQITSPATASANVTVTLNGVTFPVAVLNGDTAIQVADKIRAATYAGWTTGGTTGTDTVTFTSLTTGVKTDATYSAGTTGAAGTMSTTTQGSADLVTTILNGAGSTALTLAANATTTVSGVTITHDDTTAIQAALNALVAGSGELILPSGTYNVSAALSASILAGKQIKIKGIGKVIIQSTVPDPAAYNTTGVFTLTGTSTSLLVIENIDIEHTYASSNRGQLQGMRLNTFQSVILENVTVNNVSDIGIQLCNVNGGYANNCYCTNNNYAGLAIQGTIDFTVNKGQYNANGGNNGGTTEGYGITCETSDPVLLVNNERIIIQGVKANNNVGKGIDCHNCLVLTIQDNHVNGFLYDGIYAVNESATKAVSDVKILNNFIDGATMTVAGQGIQAGSYGATQTVAFGTLEIIGNTIKNTDFAGSYGILVSNANTGGISPSKVVIAKNVMKNASPSNGYIIRSDSGTIPIDTIIVSNNIIHAVSCVEGIGLNSVTTAMINNNIVTVDSGTVTKGIATSSTCHAIYTNNQLEGAATYTTPVEVFSTQLARSNRLNGAATSDAVVAFGDSADYGKKIQTGTATVTIPSGTKVATSLLVTFPVAYASAPRVFANIQNGTVMATIEQPASTLTYSVTTTGFDINVVTTANVAADRIVNIGWMAIG